MTSVTISAAPADNEAPSAARNGRKCTPAGSISRVREKRSQSEESHRGHDRADHQRQSVAGQDLFAVGLRVVQPDDRQAQRDGEQHTADEVDFSGSSTRWCDGRLNWIITIAIKVSGTLIQNT